MKNGSQIATNSLVCGMEGDRVTDEWQETGQECAQRKELKSSGVGARGG